MIPIQKYQFIIRSLFGLFILLMLSGCKSDKDNECKKQAQPIQINYTHLERLQQLIKVNDTNCRIVHIYSEAPDYKWVEAKGEGISCVDDVARVIRLYVKDYQSSGNESLLTPIREMLEFILIMQADDGNYYNFVLQDGSINKTYRTSIKSFDWWTARGFRSICEAMSVFQDKDPDLYQRLYKSAELTVNRMNKLLINNPDKPEIGKDMAANLVLALLTLRENTSIIEVDPLIENLVELILEGREESSEEFPYVVHKSWRNIWHAWGALQVEALARASVQLKQPQWLESAIEEGEGFHRLLVSDGFISQMEFQDGDTTNVRWFEQIAYGISSIVHSQLGLYAATGNEDFLVIAGLAASWFRGNNPAGEMMYDPQTGRCYDGIVNASGKINHNSGAESTIEALLTLQAVNKYPLALKAYYFKQIDEENPNQSTFQGKRTTYKLSKQKHRIVLNKEKLNRKQN